MTDNTIDAADAVIIPDTGEARLHLTGISKRFGAVRAIRHADMTVKAGSVHALVGENGAGKSTLIKIIAGAESADTGDILFEGAPAAITSTLAAIDLGIATVYQEPQLFSELTVSENIFTGREIKTGGRIDWRAQNERVVELLELIGLPGRYATAVVGSLSIAEQQQVSIAKALAGKAKVLILDEPSAILTDAEIEVLFGVVRRLTSTGVSVIYISHRLDELFRIADEVTVMRDGTTLGTFGIGELSVRRIVELMVGGIIADDKPVRQIADVPAKLRAGEARSHRPVPRRRRQRAPRRDRRPVRPRRLGRLRDRRHHLRHRDRRQRRDPARTASPSGRSPLGTPRNSASRCCPPTASSRGCSPSSPSPSTSRPGTCRCCPRPAGSIANARPRSPRT